MYAIGHVIYGLPLTKEILRAATAIIKAEPLYKGMSVDDVLAKLGFEFVYSGAAMNEPGYIGHVLGRIDEVADWHRLEPTAIAVCEDGVVKMVSIDANPKTVVEVHKKLSELPKEIKTAAPPVGVYIIWGTS